MAKRLMDRELKDKILRLIDAGGISIKQVAKDFGIPPTTIYGWWHRSPMKRKLRRGGRGGLLVKIDPIKPAGRFLSRADRAVIQSGLYGNLSLAEIGRLIGRDKSVISREIARNRNKDGRYEAKNANRQAKLRRKRPKPFKLAQNRKLCHQIEQWMDQGWSPGLIAKVLAMDSQGDQSKQVSHETIYQALYVQSRGALRQDLVRCLSTKRVKRKAQGTSNPRGTGAAFRDALKISQRPACVADRAIPGHWEGDLIVGPQSRSAIGTLVERSSRFVILLHLPGDHVSATVAKAMIQQMGGLDWHLRRSLTWDRGTEMTKYVDIQLQLQMPVYFADPYSPWQRGSNENTNRLLRHWFTKGTDLASYTPQDLQNVQDSLNARPRPTLGLKTPAQVLNGFLKNPPVATIT